MSIEVACPNCSSTLKAPEGMAGKKARCKKCKHSFRIPGGGGGESDIDSVGDSEQLSVVRESPFSFSEPTPEAKPQPANRPAKTSEANSEAKPAAIDNPFGLPSAVRLQL